MKTVKYLVLSFVVMNGVVSATQINIYNKLGKDSSVLTNANGSIKVGTDTIDCGCAGITGAVFLTALSGIILGPCAEMQNNKWKPEPVGNLGGNQFTALCSVEALKLQVNESGTCFKGARGDYYYSIKVPGAAIWNVELIPVSSVPAGATIQNML